MAKNRRLCRWAALFWLPFLLTAYAVSPALAAAEEEGITVRGAEVSEVVPPVLPETQTTTEDIFAKIGLLVRRWIVIGPNIMATDVTEQRQQVVRALQQDQEEREESRKRQERRRTVGAGSVQARATPAPVQTKELAQPAATLVARQSDGQVAALSAQIQSLSLASSAVSQASRLVSQTSQQLAQQVTQLSQSTDQLSQSVQQLRQSVQSAQSAQQSAQSAAQQASQSATSAISAAQASAASSASAAIASNLASATSSVSSVIAAASASAGNVASLASSQVQSAKADATIARADAATQVKQAQGTAVSVTQAALAIVGTFIGSVLLTILSFYLVLRCRGNRRRPSRQSRGYPPDVKLRSPPAGSNGGGRAGRDSSGGNDAEKRLKGYDSGGGGGAYGRASQQSSRYSRDSMQQQSAADPGFGSTVIGSPPSGRKGVVTTSTGGVGGKNVSSFSLFPKTPTPRGPPGDRIGIAVGSRDTQDMTHTVGAVSGSVASTPQLYSAAATTMTAMTATVAQARTVNNNPTRPPPSLQQWLRQGTVSPFGTLRDMRAGGQAGPGWPFAGAQQQSQTMSRPSVGVGGVNVSGGSGPGRVMQPGGPLPLRSS